MKQLACILLCGISIGCTTVYRDGKPILRTFANADLLEFHQGDTSLRMVKMNHAVATRAFGSVVGTAFMGATSFSAASMTRGIFPKR